MDSLCVRVRYVLRDRIIRIRAHDKAGTEYSYDLLLLFVSVRTGLFKTDGSGTAVSSLLYSSKVVTIGMANV